MQRSPLLAACLLALTACSSTSTSPTLSPAEVTTSALADHSVTNPKLADGAVDGRVLAAGSVGSAQLASGAVTATNLAPDAAVLGLNGLTGAITVAGSANVSVMASANTLTLGLTGAIDASSVGGIAPADLLRLDGTQSITGAPTFAATGSPPFAVTSSQVVSNLNADLLDGVDSSALARKVNNVIQVAATGGDFTTIQAAIDSITDASSTNRYLIRIAPGLYPERPRLIANVVLQGSGDSLTLIEPPGQTFGQVTPVVTMQDGDELRDLSVICGDPGTGGVPAVAVQLSGSSGSLVLRDVKVTNDGIYSTGILVTGGGQVTLDRAEVRVTAAAWAQGYVSSGADALLARSSVLSAKPGGPTLAYSQGSGSATFVDTQLDGTVQGTATCVGSYSGSFTALSSTCG